MEYTSGVKADISEKKRLLREIQELDFVVLELNLYLDNHPHDTVALAKAFTTAQQKHSAYMEYIRNFGPLRHDDVLEQGSWLWAEQDFPWDL